MSDYVCLWQHQDAHGEVRVLDDGEYRVLSFGDNDEQSKQLKLAPYVPQHTYVQAMLLASLFVEPKSAIVLGLGGGALVHALKRLNAGIKLTAVELRPAVIEAATRFFQVQPSKKLQLIEADALAFLQAQEHKRVDMIFADIYTNDGVDTAQLSEAFMVAAKGLLKSKGLLVLNCWKEHSLDAELQARLAAHFSQVYGCLTTGGNWVIFAATDANTLRDSGLKAASDALSSQLDFQASRSLSRFGPWD